MIVEPRPALAALRRAGLGSAGTAHLGKAAPPVKSVFRQSQAGGFFVAGFLDFIGQIQMLIGYEMLRKCGSFFEARPGRPGNVKL
jgi:hypothetical protein